MFRSTPAPRCAQKSPRLLKAVRVPYGRRQSRAAPGQFASARYLRFEIPASDRGWRRHAARLGAKTGFVLAEISTPPRRRRQRVVRAALSQQDARRVAGAVVRLVRVRAHSLTTRRRCARGSPLELLRPESAARSVPARLTRVPATARRSRLPEQNHAGTKFVELLSTGAAHSDGLPRACAPPNRGLAPTDPKWRRRRAAATASASSAACGPRTSSPP